MLAKSPGAVAGGADLDAFLHRMDSQLAGWDDPIERLRQALANDELALYCQPIVAIADMARYPMAEVLVRLHEEERSMLPPGEFLPLFEHHRMMAELDRWVIRGTLRHLKRGGRIGRMAVNVSMQSVQDAAFPVAIAEELLAAEVPGSALVFEIDEATLLAGGEALARFCAALKKLDCGVTIDGFGRRAATFAPLRGSWVDYVKVEGAIVRKLVHSEIAEIRLRAVLHVGEVLGFKVIAEMVEDAELVAKLMSLGVPLAQGFGLCRPRPIDAFAAR